MASASSSSAGPQGPGRRRLFYPKIDLHTHILPEHMPNWTQRFGYGDFIRLDHYCDCKARMYRGDKFFREIDENCYRVAPRLRDMEATQVHVQALSTVPVMFNYNAKPEDTLELARFLNDHLARVCNQDPTRFIALGTLPMQDAQLAIQELRRCITELGMPGVQIGSSINDMDLSHPALFPIFQEAERLGACIFVHPWDMPGTANKNKYWLPWLVEMPAATAHAICHLIFGGVMERLPQLRFCFAHGAGSFPGTIGRIEHGFNVRPDLVAVDNSVPPRDYLGRFWADSLVHDKVALRHLVALFGREKVALGSDYPFPLGEHHPGQLVETMEDFDDELKAQLLWTNGLQFLGVKEERFGLPPPFAEPGDTDDDNDAHNVTSPNTNGSDALAPAGDVESDSATTALQQLSLDNTNSNDHGGSHHDPN